MSLSDEAETTTRQNAERSDQRSSKLLRAIFTRTLYCAKGNYEFGISRIIKSLDPHNKKLGTDTWFYTKRCFMSLIENLAKHMNTVKDSVLQECLQFLDLCEIHGKTIKTVIDNPVEGLKSDDGKNTVAYEARLLKYLLLKVQLN